MNLPNINIIFSFGDKEAANSPNEKDENSLIKNNKSNYINIEANLNEKQENTDQKPNNDVSCEINIGNYNHFKIGAYLENTNVDNCERCDSDDINQCTGCKSGYRLDEAKNVCIKCKEGCATCSNDNNCGYCDEGYFVKKRESKNGEYDAECGKCTEGCGECYDEIRDWFWMTYEKLLFNIHTIEFY